jgi:hypothetical protein
MLCDEWLAFEQSAARRSGDRDVAASARAQAGILAEASRFVIAPDAVALLAEICADTTAESFDAARAHCVAPAYRTWIEWFCPKRQARVGFLLEGEAPDMPAVRGRACIVVMTKTIRGNRIPTDLHCSWDMPSTGPAMTMDAASVEAIPTLQTMLPNLREDFGEDLIRTLITALALIASPRLSQATPVDLSAVNKKRRRLGRNELLSHSEISLALQPEADDIDAGGRSEIAGRKAFHHVRAHFRFKRGRLELVRHHTKGDKALGIVRQRFTLRGDNKR